MKKSAQILDNAINNNLKIAIYGDYDADGFCGLYCFKTMFDSIFYSNYICVPYTERTHNVDKNIRTVVMDTNIDLLLIVDTGSGEEDLEELSILGFVSDVIVMDHHLLQYSVNELADSITLVNPTSLDNYPHLSGACVAYEVCIEYLSTYRPDKLKICKKYLTFLAFAALYSDSIYGNNSYCHKLYKEAQSSIPPSAFNYLQYYNPSKRFILFSFAPPLNACFRGEYFYILNDLFLSKKTLTMLDRDKLISDMQNIREYSRWVSDVLVASTHNSRSVLGNFTLVDLSGMLNQKIPNKHIWHNKGLVANRIAAEEENCCITITSTGNRYTLSCRDYLGRDVYSLFKSFFKVGGHNSAFGGELSYVEVIQLKETLSNISNYLTEPQKRNVLKIDNPTFSELNEIADENEFRHEKDVVLVSIPRNKFEVKWTPESFKDRFEQLVLNLGEKQVYIKKENVTDGQARILIHFYKGRRLHGSIVSLKEEEH